MNQKVKEVIAGELIKVAKDLLAVKEVWVDSKGEVVYAKGEKTPFSYWEFQEAKDMKSGAVVVNGKKFYAPFKRSK